MHKIFAAVLSICCTNCLFHIDTVATSESSESVVFGCSDGSTVSYPQNSGCGKLISMLVNTNTTAASLSAVDGQHLLNSLFRTVNDERFTVPVEFVNKFVTMHWEHEPYVLPADADKNQLWQLLILQIKKLINFNLLKFVVEAVRNTATIRAYRRTNDCSIIDATYDCCKRAFWNDMVSPRSFNKVLECGHPWSELGKGLEQLDKQQLRSRLIHIKTLAPWFANGDWLGGLSDELLKKL